MDAQPWTRITGSDVIQFRCDDAAGFSFRILRARDGDFHLSIVPIPEDLKAEEGEGAEEMYRGCYSASVRIRMPMIGGGAHEELWHSLAQLFQKLYKP